MNTRSRSHTNDLPFSAADELSLVQLEALGYLFRRQGDTTTQTPSDSGMRTSSPSAFQLNVGRTPYLWQRDALKAWQQGGRRGIVKVVTGAGKTVLALEALEEMFRLHPSLRVSIVVPTVVLMEQWYHELVTHSNISLDLVGRHGGGLQEAFASGKRIVIWVINSAARSLIEDVDRSGVGQEHLLVVDECHRAGAPEFRRIFEVQRLATLGLSATPEREGVEEEGEDDADGSAAVETRNLSLLERELGPIVYELTFSDAVDEGIIPRFEVVNYAIDLTAPERAKYDRLSRELHDLEEELKRSEDFQRVQGRKRVSNQFALFRSLADRARDGHIRRKAVRYERLASERRRLLYGAKNRTRCFLEVLKGELKAGAQVIVFHEVIERINELYATLVRQGLPVVLYHSQLPDSLREKALRLYWERTARVIISARALIEGYNVPSTDVGIVLASSSSPRQRIQTMGRVLRTYPGKDFSRIYNIYVHESADEYIFMRYAWDQFIGAASVQYARWRGPGAVEVLPGPPYTPKPREHEIDDSHLTPGCEYPGPYEGEELSVDVQGRVFRLTDRGNRQYSVGNDVGSQILQVKGSAGVFKVTPQRGHVLVRRPSSDQEWETYFVTTLPRQFEFERDTGDYIEYRYSQRFGGAIVMSEHGIQRIDNETNEARTIIGAVQRVPRERGWPLPSRVYVAASDKCTVYIRNLEGRFEELCKLEQPFEIPVRSGASADLG